MQVLMTGTADLQTAVDALNHAEIVCILRKPFAPTALSETIDRALRRQESFGPIIQERLLAQAAAQNFKEAVEKNLIQLAVQPIVSAQDTSKIEAVECLIRSRHDVLKGPMQVLDAAERAGQIFQLGRVVNGLAAKWAERLPEQIQLFVNMHPHQLDDPEVLYQFEPLFPYAHRIVLEVTERAGLHEVPRWDTAVEKLSAKGFQFAVDDLGMGHSGLFLLAQLRPKCIKVDQSIIRNIDQESYKARIISMLVNFANATGSRLVAEGVETVAESAAVIDCGAHLLQGFYYARPSLDWPVPGY
jgi:EAL domain-containing protein (putative c-di-GMP-specific phosphodiesterase class I)